MYCNKCHQKLDYDSLVKTPENKFLCFDCIVEANNDYYFNNVNNEHETGGFKKWIFG